jgi:hypothetical protein
MTPRARIIASAVTNSTLCPERIPKKLVGMFFQPLRSSSGSLATLTAMLLASSRVSRLAAHNLSAWRFGDARARLRVPLVLVLGHGRQDYGW